MQRMTTSELADQIDEGRPVVDGIRLLTQEEFSLWWGALDAQDRLEFQYTYGGSPRLARFVCAIDKLLVAGARRDGIKGTLKEAYVMATGRPLASAKEADGPSWYKHDAVQSLLARLRHRERVLVWIRIEQKYAQLVEKGLDAALKEDGIDVKLFDAVLRGAATFGKAVNMEEAHERISRTKRGVANAREAAAQANIKPTQEQLIEMLRALKNELGPEEFDQLVYSAKQKELPS